MKLDLKVASFLLLFSGLLMLLGNNVVVAGLDCCYIPEAVAEDASAKAPAFIEVVPTGLSAGVGEVQTVYVTVLDKDKKPVPNVLVTASSDTPNRASVGPEEIKTDANGKAVFTVKGVAYFSGSRAIITFKAGDAVGTVETAQQYL
ncbi:MAG: Ig-like domain-containing protein [Planctomycetes bacterium]|nr:Ig-like domain-containing protein [Planctomycetota bacterium]